MVCGARAVGSAYAVCGAPAGQRQIQGVLAAREGALALLQGDHGPAQVRHDLPEGHGLGIDLAAALRDGRIHRAEHDRSGRVKRPVWTGTGLDDGAPIPPRTYDGPSPSERARLVIPFATLRRDRQGEYVYRLTGDERAERVTVTSGQKIGNRIEVLEGLGQGDRVVVKGFLGLKDAMPVQVVGRKAQD